MRIRHGTAATLVLAFALVSCSDIELLPPSSPRAPAFDHIPGLPHVRISEIHYDNTGTDADERIEISGPAGTDVTGWRVILYNGSNGASYLPVMTLNGTIPATCGTRGVIVLAYGVNGIQNGSPDGIALVDAADNVIEFLSYEGVFTAVGGPANGRTSTDIGVSQSGNEPLGSSLQRSGSGANVWAETEGSNTFGTCNDDDEALPPPPPPPPAIPDTRFSEIHYDNGGTDIGEAIEIESSAGADLSAWSVVLYNGSNGTSYNTTSLTGLEVNECDGRQVVVIDYPSNGIQNGSPDGMALVNPAGIVVEFLSYEGTFTAAGGPADGLTATNIGVSEAGNENPGLSLQRDALGVWSGPAAHSFGVCNGSDEEPPEQRNTLTIVGRFPSDAPLPVGFEDQLFATLLSPQGDTLETTITWTVETAEASIDARGVLRALAPGTALVRATAALDGTTATISLPTHVASASTTAAYEGNTEFGVPADADATDDHVVVYPQYTASYNGARGIPNWVSYNLEQTHFGPEDRCDCFTFDPQLPASFTRYTTADYTGAGTFHGYGIDRGHLVRSADRTSGSLDNARTYFFSNIIPQAADNNQGPWSDLEIVLGNLARNQNREVYIIAGASGSKGTVKNEGLITIPEQVWKVAVIMPRDHGLENVDSYDDVEIIAVVMPNEPGIRNVDWQEYETTVDAVEAVSGYDVLALLPDHIEIAVESNTQPPEARTDGPYESLPNLDVMMSAAASTDADGQALTYAWGFGDGTTGTGVTVTHAYARAGEYTVQLVVTDALGLADTTSTSVTVLTQAQGVRQVIDLVTELETNGRLSKGNANSLIVKLQAAVQQLERGAFTAALGQLDAFRNEVSALFRAGRMSEEDVEALRTAAGRVVDSLSD